MANSPSKLKFTRLSSTNGSSDNGAYDRAKAALDAGFETLAEQQIDRGMVKDDTRELKGVLAPEAMIGWVDIDTVFPMGSEEWGTSTGESKGQPREYFNEERLQELADNIREFGQKQPCLVRAVRARHASNAAEYGLISGERRWRAMKMLGETRILVRVQQTDRRHAFRQAMLDDLTSEKFSPIERGKGFVRVKAEMEEELKEYIEAADLQDVSTAWNQSHFEKLNRVWKGQLPKHIERMAQHAITAKRTPKVGWDDVCNVYGFGRSSVASFIRMAELDPKIQEAVTTGILPIRSANLLAGVDNQTQKTLFREVQRKGLTSDALAERVREEQNKAPLSRRDTKAGAQARAGGFWTERVGKNKPTRADVEKAFAGAFDQAPTYTVETLQIFIGEAGKTLLKAQREFPGLKARADWTPTAQEAFETQLRHLRSALDDLEKDVKTTL